MSNFGVPLALVLGWPTVEVTFVTCDAFKNSVDTSAVRFGALSDCILVEVPCRETIFAIVI